ncbi:MAG: AIM24 family protein [Actinomycetota bacterium]|nr:AIM24 family protein [Actinomycetota bacterium]
MQVKLRHNPSFTIARCLLAPGEPLRVEGGAMIAHSEGVLLESKAQGGVMKGLAHRVLGGGSFWIANSYGVEIDTQWGWDGKLVRGRGLGVRFLRPRSGTALVMRDWSPWL